MRASLAACALISCAAWLTNPAWGGLNQRRDGWNVVDDGRHVTGVKCDTQSAVVETVDDYGHATLLDGTDLYSRAAAACVQAKRDAYDAAMMAKWWPNRVIFTVTEDRGEVVGTVTGQATDLLGSYLRCQDISCPVGTTTCTGCTSAINAECSKTGHGTFLPGSPGSGKWDEINKTCSGACPDGAKVEFKCSKTAPVAPKGIIDEPEPTSIEEHTNGTPCVKGTQGCK